MQIETAPALDAVEEIAALDGVDVLFVGPRDLSHALDVPGDPRRRSTSPRSNESSPPPRQHGKAAGLLVPDGAAAARMTAAGWQFLAIGSDTTLLADAVVAELRRAVTPRMTTLSRTDVVVALGDVEPELVTDHLPASATFVADPTADDLHDATGAIVRADALVDSDLLDRMPLLRVLARTGVGVERVDVDEATRRGIAVVVTPGAGTNAVAEGTLAMTLHLVKRLRATTACVAEGRWSDRGQISLGDLEGATIGIVGYGRIGRRVAHLARAFGMTVLAYDPYLEDDPDVVSLEEVRRRAAGGHAAPAAHAARPTTSSTRSSSPRLQPGTILVNCGRGGLLDLDAAHAALVDGRLAGLGLDVFETEPPEHHPVFDRADVVLSPHLMGLSVGATRATFAAAAQGVADVLAGRRPAALANAEWQPAT